MIKTTNQIIKIFNSDYFYITSIETKTKFKPLTMGLKNKGGRSYGRITTPRRGNLHKRTYRAIDRKRNILAEAVGIIFSIQHVINFTALFGLVGFIQGLFVYILLPQKIKKFDIIKNYTESPKIFGDSAKLRYIPNGSLIYNVSLSPKGIGLFSRAAGTSALLIRKSNGAAVVKLKSGVIRLLPDSCTATLGTVSNTSHHLRELKYAGVSRHLGCRPRNRPSARNPVDHPMGGRTKGGAQPMNKKGAELNNKKTKRFHFIGLLQKSKFRRVTTNKKKKSKEKKEKK